MFLHIKLCYLSVVSRVETSKILKNCISNTVSVDFSCFKYNFSHFFVKKNLCPDLVFIFFELHSLAEVFEYDLFSEILCLAVAILRSQFEALRLLQRVDPLQGPGI